MPAMTHSALVLRAPVTLSPATDWELPVLPADWRPAPDRRVITPYQRFMEYAAGGPTVTLHSIREPEEELPGRVALLTLGRHRVGLHRDCVPDGFVAVWSAAGAVHRLAARPVTLGAFMELLMRIDWNA
ncbi:MAG: hypothetical protein HOV79_34930 [Hamadaea sp.]|nr:hypothetical protein [Hamadaea sp.]